MRNFSSKNVDFLKNFEKRKGGKLDLKRRAGGYAYAHARAHYKQPLRKRSLQEIHI